jgi:8-oxo-dGTP pyrophosphatase MutT (NUDIX family)
MPVAAIASILRASPKPVVGDTSSIARVRCVLMRKGRYLLAQHNSRRRDRMGRWGLPGGRLRASEKPKACLRRELLEELGCEVPYLKRLGDWLHGDELHRVFGCEIDEPIETFAADELLAIGWFTYEETAELAVADKLRTGFELAAITEFRRQHRLRREKA